MSDYTVVRCWINPDILPDAESVQKAFNNYWDAVSVFRVSRYNNYEIQISELCLTESMRCLREFSRDYGNIEYDVSHGLLWWHHDMEEVL